MDDLIGRRDGWISALVFCFIGILGPATALYGQCSWAMGPTCAPTGGGPYSMCSRNVSPTDVCNLDADNGMGTLCTKTTMMTFGTLVNLMATQALTGLQSSAFCEWGCGAQICRISLSDGLPVELMGFSLEGDGEGNTE